MPFGRTPNPVSQTILVTRLGQISASPPSSGCPHPGDELEICPVALVHGLEKLDIILKSDYGYRCGGCSIYMRWPNPNWAYVRDLFVVPEKRGCGIGQALTLAVYDWVRAETDTTWVYTDFVTANPAGSLFWPAQGFRSVKYVLRRCWPGLAPCSELVFR